MKAIDAWLGPLGRAAVWKQRRYRETEGEYKERMAMKCKRCGVILDEAGLCECDYDAGNAARLREACVRMLDEEDHDPLCGVCGMCEVAQLVGWRQKQT